MPAPAPFLGYGNTGYWEPGMRKQRRLGDLDTLRGVWIDDEGNTLMPGDAVPEHPGMIIMESDEEDGGAGSVAYRVNALGSLDNQRPYKVISVNEQITQEPTWDRVRVDMFHTASRERVFAVAAATDQFTLIGGGPMAYHNGDKIRILERTGGNPLTTYTQYYVVQVSGDSFKLSTTLGGSPVNITSDGAGTLVLSLFLRGIGYDELPGNYNVFLQDIERDSIGEVTGLPWVRVRLNFMGIVGSKPYKRTITVNGKTISNDSLWWGLEGGGWVTPQKGTAQQPVLEVSDLMVCATDPELYAHVPTSDVFNSLSETRDIPNEIVIPDPPDVTALFGDLTGPDVRAQWPNHWAFVACEKVDSLPFTNVCLIRKVWRYEYPLTL